MKYSLRTSLRVAKHLQLTWGGFQHGYQHFPLMNTSTPILWILIVAFPRSIELS